MADTSEDIKLANMLASQYGKLHTIETELYNDEAKLNDLLMRPMAKGHPGFVYFRPFMIFAIIVFAVLLFYSPFFNYALLLDSVPKDYAQITLMIPFFSAALILITGAVFAVNRKNNSAKVEAQKDFESRTPKIEKLKKAISELEADQAELSSELKQYDTLIPKQHRNQMDMKRVAYLLESGRASSIKEAVETLS